MSNTIKADELQKALTDYLENYVEDIEEDVKDTVTEVAKEAKQELVQTSPRSGIARKTKYYKGWAIRNGGRTRKKHYYGKTVWNKTNYQLTHLLEFGHATRNGGRTNPQPHIRPVEEKYGTKFVDLSEKKIRRTSK